MALLASGGGLGFQVPSSRVVMSCHFPPEPFPVDLLTGMWFSWSCRCCGRWWWWWWWCQKATRLSAFSLFRLVLLRLRLLPILILMRISSVNSCFQRP